METAPYTRLAQSVERQPFKLVVEGSSPSSGEEFHAFSLKTLIRYGLMVMISGFHPEDRGSIPRIGTTGSKP